MGEKRESILPKNVKQIGQVPNGQKIYIEDYVITYLKQMLEKEKEMRVSVLYGHKEIVENEMYWFVNGAIEAETDFFMQKTILAEDSWEKVNDLAKRFFGDMNVLGWAVARPEATDISQDQVLRTQKTFFRLDQKLYFEYITDEDKEDIFLYEKGKFKKQSGYYVYYEKNESMQNYMVSLRAQERHPEEFEADRAMRQIRENREEKKLQRSRRRTTTLLTCFSMILVTTIMIIGITMLNNYEKMESMERVLHQISGKMEQAVQTGDDALVSEIGQADTIQNGYSVSDSNDLEVIPTDVQPVENQGNMQLTQPENVIQTDSLQEQTAALEEPNVQDEGKATEETTSQKNASATEETAPENITSTGEETPGKTSPSEETVSQETERVAEEPSSQDAGQATEEINVASVPANRESQTVYVIKEGDTLATICLQFYGNLARIDEICEINKIDNKDNIYYGQKIILP